MSPEERKRLACRLLHRLEAAEHAIREAEELARALGLNAEYLRPASEEVVAMMNDAYMEYPGGKDAYLAAHPGRRPDGSRSQYEEDRWVNEGGASGV